MTSTSRFRDPAVPLPEEGRLKIRWRLKPSRLPGEACALISDWHELC